MHLNLSSRVVACEEQGNIASIKFEDGTTANFDLVIGADGLKSVIRRDLLTAKFPDEIDRILPIWSGSTVYRFLVPMQALSQKAADHPAITKATMVSSTAGSITTEY
jgi:salicylate hydroxylase